jgi:hypothetical protein
MSLRAERSVLFALMVALASTIGCTDSSLPSVYEAHGFSKDEIDQLQSAADEWCAKSNNAHCALVLDASPGFKSSSVTLSSSMDTDHSFGGVVVRTEHSDAVGNCLATVNHAGIRSNASCADNPDAESFAIKILDSRDGDNGVNWFHGKKTSWGTRLRTIFLHELGHAFGRSHTSKDGTVMNAITTNEAEHLTADDLVD